MRKSLLILAQAAHGLGGVPVWLRDLVPHLGSAEWSVSLGLVASRGSEFEAFVAAHPGLVGRAFPILPRTNTREGRMRALRRALRRVAPDLVLISDVGEAYGVIANERSRSASPIRMVMALHGLHPAYFEDLVQWREVLDGVVCSNLLTQALASGRSEISAKRIFYAPYGVQPAQDGGPESSSTGGRLRVAWVGRLERFQKRSGDLIRIVRELRHQNAAFSLTIVGAGPTGDILRSELESERDRDEVRFLGAIEPEEVRASVFPRSDVLLVTSLWETGPLVVWEAMARGVAVVSTRYIGSGLESSLEHEENCLLFDIGDTQGAARQIQRLENRTLRSALAGRGRELVRHSRSLARSMAAWESALSAVLAAPALSGVAARAQDGAAGRLDRWLGQQVGEAVRAMVLRIPRERATAEPWPFTGGASNGEDREFWNMAATVDGRPLPAHLWPEGRQDSGDRELRLVGASPEGATTGENRDRGRA